MKKFFGISERLGEETEIFQSCHPFSSVPSRNKKRKMYKAESLKKVHLFSLLNIAHNNRAVSIYPPSLYSKWTVKGAVTSFSLRVKLWEQQKSVQPELGLNISGYGWTVECLTRPSIYTLNTGSLGDIDSRKYLIQCLRQCAALKQIFTRLNSR